MIYVAEVRQEPTKQAPKPQMRRVDGDPGDLTENGQGTGDFNEATQDWSKVRRNDRCPCGSGKRFKKCCLKSGRF